MVPSLGADDSAYLVPRGSTCAQRDSTLATGAFVESSSSSTTTFRFGLLFVAQEVVVCYVRYLSLPLNVAPNLIVVAGVPSYYTTSNTPIAGRLTTVTFPQFDVSVLPFGIGDAAKIVCAACSCWTDAATQTDFGSASVVVDTAAATPRMRLGLAVGLYRVCYRLTTSTWAQVGGLLAVAETYPTSFTSFPASPLQGQRITITLSGTSGRIRANDSVILVTPDRGCWLTPSENATGLLPATRIASSNATSAVFTTHFPTLGLGSTNWVYPLQALVCVRERNQDEYAMVPSPLGGISIQPPLPNTFTSVPTPITIGHINAQVNFVDSVESDSVYVVWSGLPVTSTSNNRTCDDPSSTVVVPKKAATALQFTAEFGLAETATEFVLCYTKAGATVAEVPKLLTLSARNPSRWQADTTLARRRQYINLTFVGHSLSTSSDAVVLSAVPCANKIPPQVGATRQSDQYAITGTENLYVVSQSLDMTKLYACYLRGGAWSQVPPVLELASPNIKMLTLPRTILRAGQQVALGLTVESGTSVVAVAAVPYPRGWCHNTSNVEAALRVLTNESLVSNLWEYVGAVRICVQESGAPWSDVAVASLTDPSQVTVLPANPSSMSLVPAPVHAGQRLTLTFELQTAADGLDVVKFVPYQSVCDTTDALLRPVTVAGPLRATLLVLDPADPKGYESFTKAQNLTVCYRAVSEGVWAAVGGSWSKSALNVLPRVPDTWSTVGGREIFVQTVFQLRFTDATGSAALNPALDEAWLVPENESCAVVNCTACHWLPMDRSVGSAVETFTKKSMISRVANFTVCYRLSNGAASAVIGVLNVTLGDVECTLTEAVRVGQQTVVVFRTKLGAVINTTEDYMVGSVLADPANPLSCEDLIAPGFAEWTSRWYNQSDLTVGAALEWPVEAADAKYAVCLRHLSRFQRICSCRQIDEGLGDCYLRVDDAIPKSFTPYPLTQYIGQYITVTLDTPAVFPVANVSLVAYTDGRQTCRDPPTIVLGPPWRLTSYQLANISFLSQRVGYKYPYTAAGGSYIVCAKTSLSGNWSRVPGGVVLPAAHRVLVRSFVTWEVAPPEAELHRAWQTLDLSFAYLSTDSYSYLDVFNASDQIFFVSQVEYCNESAIDANAALQKAMSTYTYLLSLPTNPLSATQTTSVVRVTFTQPTTVFVCYRPLGGTWALANNGIALAIGKTLFETCRFMPGAASRYALRAKQYARFWVAGKELVAKYAAATDRTRLVREGVECNNATQAPLWDDDVIFTSASGYILSMLYSNAPGKVTVCYKLSSSPLYSPACRGVTLHDAFPPRAVMTRGCPAVGQTINASLSRSVTSPMGFFSTPLDRVRFVDGAEQCDALSGVLNSSIAVLVNGQLLALPGGRIRLTADGSANIGVVRFTKDGSYRLCYRDSNGTHSAVGFDASADTVTVHDRTPRSVSLYPKRPQVGQRVQATFAVPTTPYDPLTPSAPESSQWIQPPAYDGRYWDGAGYVSVSALGKYPGEGFCEAHRPATTSVVGNTSRTVAAFYPTLADTVTVCYIPLGCSYVDVPVNYTSMTLRFYEANPESSTVSPLSPRRGQLINVTYYKNKNESDALNFSADDFAAFSDSATCYDTSSAQAAAVKGNTSVSSIVGFLPALGPAFTEVTAARTCYKLKEGVWSSVPDGVYSVLPANPTHFTAFPSYPTQYQPISITFHGSNLGPLDRAKVVPLAANCSDGNVPLATTAALNMKTGEMTPGTGYLGWPVASTASTASTLTFTSNVSGVFSVCYRMASDSVWTLVYSNLLVAERNPSSCQMTPATALEGELFTLNCTASSTNVQDPLTSAATMELYFGSISSCLLRSASEIIVTGPSREDLLPTQILFQMASGVRGLHTLCYVHPDPVTGDRVVSWGFDPVWIGANPTAYVTRPTTLRALQLSRIEFRGYGLQAQDNKSDSIMFILPTQSCLTASTSLLTILQFTATGNTSTVTVTAPTPLSYQVCYRLYGGRWQRVLPDVVFGSANPISIERTKDVIRDNELLQFWLTYSDGGWRQRDYVFVSTTGCFTQHDLSSPTYLDTATYRMYGELRFPAAGNYSLCYEAPDDPPSGSTSIIARSMEVLQGQPIALGYTIQATQNQLIRLNLSIPFAQRTSDDYVTVVDAPAKCVGVQAPERAAVSPLWAVDFMTNTANGTVVGAFTAVGSLYLCASNRVAECSVATRECGRIIGTITVSTAALWDWSSSSSSYTVYLQNVVGIAFVSSRSIDSKNYAWLTPLVGDNAYESCYRTMLTNTDASTVQVLTYNSSLQLWTTVATAVGVWVPCFAATQSSLPAAFGSGKTLTVSYAQVSRAQLVNSNPQATLEMSVDVFGSGLTLSDTCFFIASSGNCAATSLLMRISCRFLTQPNSLSTTMNTNRVASNMSVAGEYALCYLPAGSAPSAVPSRLLTVTVGSVITGYTMSTTPVANQAFDIFVSGISLQSGDRAALINATNSTTVADCATATYVQVIAVSSDNSASTTRMTSPKGTYALCYAPQYGVTHLLQAPALVVAARDVVGLSFLTVPVCMELDVCSVQPRLALVNSSGLPAAEPNVVISLRLLSAADSTDKSAAMQGASSTAFISNTYFQAYAFAVIESGTFTLEATATLIGGTQLRAVSVPFTVAVNLNRTTVTLRCTPSMVDRYSGKPSTCTITRLLPYAANLAGVPTVVPSGYVSAVQIVDTFRSTFTVSPLTDDLATQFMLVTVALSSSGQRVDGSPALIYVATPPNASSTLQCFPKDTDASLPGTSYVRFGSTLQCVLTPYITNANNERTAVYTDPAAFVVRATTVGASTKTTADVSLTDSSVVHDANGQFVFYVSVNQAFATSVSVDVRLSSSGSVVQNSPVEFLVVGVPTIRSSLQCVGEVSLSTSVSLPDEKLNCVFTSQSNLGPILALGSDLVAEVSDGAAVVTAIGAFDVGSQIRFAARSPSAPLTAIGARRTGERFLSRRSLAHLLALSTDDTFGVSVTYWKNGTAAQRTTVASYQGVLVYVTNIVEPAVYLAGQEVVLALSGSGISASDTFTVCDSASCVQDTNRSGAAPPVTVQPTTSGNTVRISFRAPNYPYYVCHRANGTSKLLLLTSKALNNATTTTSTKKSGLDRDDWIAIIVGIVLVGILLLLLPLVVWYVIYRRRVKYFPARVNTNFIYSGPSTPPEDKVLFAPRTIPQLCTAEEEERALIAKDWLAGWGTIGPYVSAVTAASTMQPKPFKRKTRRQEEEAAVRTPSALATTAG